LSLGKLWWSIINSIFPYLLGFWFAVFDNFFSSDVVAEKRWAMPVASSCLHCSRIFFECYYILLVEQVPFGHKLFIVQFFRFTSHPEFPCSLLSVFGSITSSFPFQELLSQDGLFSSNKQIQSAALCSLSTLMTITPNDTFLEFEKVILLPRYLKWSLSYLFSHSWFMFLFIQHFIGLQERTLHDSFSENDIKVDFANLLMKFDLK